MPYVEQLMQNLQQLTQITQLLGNAMVQNNQRGQPDLSEGGGAAPTLLCRGGGSRDPRGVDPGA